jgi:hypothetical protein
MHLIDDLSSAASAGYGCWSAWPPMTDEPDAGALSAASPRRRAGQGAVVFAIRLPGSRTSAKAKTSAPRIAERPAAGVRSEPDDRLGSSEIWAGEGGNLGARRGRLLRRRARRGGERAAQVWRRRLSGRG